MIPVIYFPVLSCCLFPSLHVFLFFFFFNDTATTEIYTLSLHDALPICGSSSPVRGSTGSTTMVEQPGQIAVERSEEHTSELQSLRHLVCRLLLEKKNTDGALPHWPYVMRSKSATRTNC